MTDPDLIAKKLATIETCVSQLQRLSRPDLISQDVREQRFIEHTLQIAIQAALDIASHIISDDRLGEPQTNQELFRVLHNHHWISSDLSEKLRQMAGFRNILVHGYNDVDLEIVRDITENHLGDLLDFVERIRSRMTE